MQPRLLRGKKWRSITNIMFKYVTQYDMDQPNKVSGLLSLPADVTNFQNTHIHIDIKQKQAKKKKKKAKK